MTPISKFRRKSKDKNGFVAKARVVMAFLEKHDLTFEQAYHQACLVDGVLMPEEASVKRTTVAGWLAIIRFLWDKGLVCYRDSTRDYTIPKEVHGEWLKALRLEKRK